MSQPVSTDAGRRLAVDVGGTFIDYVLLDEVHVWKQILLHQG